MAAPLFIVDAFTERAFSGNPAGVCLLEGPAEEATMQGLAAELGFSETAFVDLATTEEPLALRWFTPTVEVDLCGHATLATAHVLTETGRLASGRVRFGTRSGTLEVRRTGRRFAMDLPASTPVPLPAAAVAAEAGTGPEVLAGCPVVAVAEARGGGRPDLVVETVDHRAVRRAVPDLATLARCRWRALLLTAPGSGGPDYVLRVFGPAVGIPEDPATGSAHGVLGPYWCARHEQPTLEARQLSERGGAFTVEVDEATVTVTGSAVTVAEGRCLLL